MQPTSVRDNITSADKEQNGATYFQIIICSTCPVTHVPPVDRYRFSRPRAKGGYERKNRAELLQRSTTISRVEDRALHLKKRNRNRNDRNERRRKLFHNEDNWRDIFYTGGNTVTTHKEAVHANVSLHTPSSVGLVFSTYFAKFHDSKSRPLGGFRDTNFPLESERRREREIETSAFD